MADGDEYEGDDVSDFVFFDSIEYNLQSSAQYRCRNIIGDDVAGCCIDAHDDLPAGSTQRHDPGPDMSIGPFCSTTTVWRES